MKPIHEICQITGSSFEISNEEQEFLSKLSEINSYLGEDIPFPKIHPLEDLRRIFSFQNLVYLYRRKSDLSGKSLLARYPLETGLKVVSPEEYWSGNIDNLEFGKDYDFKRSFFEQWQELLLQCRILAVTNINAENSEYANGSLNIRNCYLSFNVAESQDCFYALQTYGSNDIISCVGCMGCQYCYNSVDIENCYECQNCRDCKNSHNCIACLDLIGCNNCIGCVGLRNVSYYIYNKPVNETAYKNFLNNLNLGVGKKRAFFLNQAEEFIESQNHQINRMINCENSSGETLRNCKNIFQSFFTNECEDCGYLLMGRGSKDAWRGFIVRGELAYRSITIDYYNNIFCFASLGNKNIIYSAYCYTQNENCFGCVGLNRKSYCILNKQYSKNEYYNLVSRIVKQMKATGEWGQFFPLNFSPSPYKETISNLFFATLSDDQIKARGYLLGNFEADIKGEASYVRDLSVDDISLIKYEDIASKRFICEKSNKLYTIQKKEFAFYQKYNIALPGTHWRESIYSLCSNRHLIPDVVAKS